MAIGKLFLGWTKFGLWLLIVTFYPWFLVPSPSSATGSDVNQAFDGQAAYHHVLTQTAFGPRPVGSEASQQTADYIIHTLQAAGWEVEIQPFLFKGVPGRNIIAKAGTGPLTILGAHYDTRSVADRDPNPALRSQPIVGANDGASGTAVLLELAGVLNVEASDQTVWLAFFDAEDQGLINGWPYSVGARVMAGKLPQKPSRVIIVDMVGDTNQTLYLDYNSQRPLSESIWQTATELGYGDFFIPQPRHRIVDDHLPFAEQGIPAVDIIDFDYSHWHTTADTTDKVSPDSLERVGRTLVAWLEKPSEF